MELYVRDRSALMEDEALLEGVRDLASDSHLLERSASSAERFVYGVEDDRVVSFCSLRSCRGGDGVEVYYVVVDPAMRGAGYGGRTFDRGLQEAEDMGRDRDADGIYMDVWDDTTELYYDVKEEVMENEDFFSESFMPAYCEERGLSVEDLVDENTAMKHLAESRGFVENDSNGSFRHTQYYRPLQETTTERSAEGALG